MANLQRYKDCGCSLLTSAAGTLAFKQFGCSQNCAQFNICSARLVVAELDKPEPTGKPYTPKKQVKRRGPTNAELAMKYGVTKRQAAKAINESARTGKSVHSILKNK